MLELEGNLATTIFQMGKPKHVLFVNIYGIAYTFRITLKLPFFFFGLTFASQTEIPRDKLEYIKAQVSIKPQLDC